MLSEVATFTIALVFYGGILLLLTYYILTLADFECNYLNVHECCGILNFWVIPKFGCHLFVNILMFIDGYWLMVALNLPMTIWLGYELKQQRKDSLGVYDPVDIHSRGLLKIHLRNIMIYLGYYLVLFFTAVYFLLIYLIKDDPIRRHEDDEIVTEL